jgi:hypothetical protein
LFLKKREILVLDAVVGKAAVQRLINGPVESNLAPISVSFAVSGPKQEKT